MRKRHEISLPDEEWNYLIFLSKLEGKSKSKLISKFIDLARKEEDPYSKLRK